MVLGRPISIFCLQYTLGPSKFPVWLSRKDDAVMCKEIVYSLGEVLMYSSTMRRYSGSLQLRDVESGIYGTFSCGCQRLDIEREERHMLTSQEKRLFQLIFIS
ncbi:hypothetical protein AB6A40_003516 [Gnathostoma spinigerum]|uniref:Uncharacterized protein n=1 Tax=Gnathostoma spinigerum TaxID=75299 RepID=A0ABD6EJS1_9BILA